MEGLKQGNSANEGENRGLPYGRRFMNEFDRGSGCLVMNRFAIITIALIGRRFAARRAEPTVNPVRWRFTNLNGHRLLTLFTRALFSNRSQIYFQLVNGPNTRVASPDEFQLERSNRRCIDLENVRLLLINANYRAKMKRHSKNSLPKISR